MPTILIDAVNTSIIQNPSANSSSTNSTAAYIQHKPLFDLLQTYPNPKIIVTNANDEQMVQFGLDAVPYPVFTLKHNPDKRDLVYFKTLLAHYKLAVHDVVYFEHNIDAVRSAESVGIAAYHYDKDVRDLVALKKFLDENVGANV